MSEKTYNYTIQFEPMEVITKAGTDKKYYVEGYFSTIDEDLAMETLTESAQQDILTQIKGRTITFDVEHEVFYDKNGQVLSKPASAITIGKVVDAEMKAKGVWGKVEINDSAPRFKNIWESIQKGFLHSFSVAFYPLEAVKRKVDGVMKSFVNKLNLLNITLTGSPVNPEAKFSAVMKSAVDGFKNSFDTYDVNHNNEVTNVTDENKDVIVKSENETVVDETPVEAPKVETPVEEVKTEEAPTEAEPSVEPEVKSEPKVDFKSMLASLKSEFNAELTKSKEALTVEIKALQEQINKINEQPIKKAIKGDNKQILGVDNLKEVSVFDLM
jgi:HK97 family phage prohead protease